MLSANPSQKWSALMCRCGVEQSASQTLWGEIEAAYQKPVRHYHNLTHIVDLLDQVEKHREQISAPDDMELAVWYHDVVYRIGRSDNETRSAALAADRLKTAGLAGERIARISRMIAATQSHHLPDGPADPDLPWVLDFDLAVLGRDWPEYNDYASAIRREYRRFPDIIYNPGRKKVLRSFLESSRIYQTGLYYHQFESSARNNLARELAALS